MFQLLTKTGLSVAFLALTSVAALAQDASDADAQVTTDETTVEDGTGPADTADVVSEEDMIAWSGEVIDDEVVDDTGEEIWVDGGEGGVIVAEEVYDVDVTTTDLDGGDIDMLTESDCGGCEYFTTGETPRPMMPNARGDAVVAQSAQGWGEANDIDVFARGNICFDVETYVGFLCDWQRPFLGDMMPPR